MKIPVYIHIPKTGGTYLSQYKNGQPSVVHPMKFIGHRSIVAKTGDPNYLYWNRDKNREYTQTISKESVRGIPIIITVRNIYSWLVSYAGHAGGWNPRYRDTSHYDFEAANKGFEYLVHRIANREHPWPNRKFIFFQAFCTDREFLPDYVTRTESLDTDMENLSKKLGLTYHKREKLRVGVHKDYREYYSDKLIQCVKETWNRELYLYGYTFDNSDVGKATIKKVVGQSIKNSLMYDIEKDLLEIKGKEVSRECI